MAYLIDTSAIVELERGRRDWTELLNRAGGEPVYLPAIVWAELLAGVHLADTARRALTRRHKLDLLRTRISVLPFTAEIAELWGELFAELQRAGSPIPSNDLSIAATALFHKAKLLVGRNDEAHFRRIRNLGVETL